MSLQQVSTYTVTTPVADFYLDGIDDTSVYKLVCTNVQMSSTNADVYVRVGDSSGSDSTTNYQYASRNLYSQGSSIQNSSSGVYGYWDLFFINMQGVATLGANGSGVAYLHNWYDSAENSVILWDLLHTYTGAAHTYGNKGGGRTISAGQHTRIYFGFGGNIEKGTFTLYKVV